MGVIKLDKKNKRLLYLYTDDASQTANMLGKKVGLSREVVKYRLNRLKKLGLISGIVAKVDMSRFYQNAYCLFLRFSKLSSEIINSAIKVLQENQNTMWVASSGGEYDLITSILTQDATQLNQLIRELEEKLGANLKEYDILTYDKEYKNTYRDIFSEEGTLEHTPHVIRPYDPHSFEIDEIDEKLLYALSKNAELTNKNLGELTGLTPEAVRVRTKKLEKEKIIHGYRALLDIYKLKQEIYYVLVKFDQLRIEDEQKLRVFFLQSKQVYYSAKVVGKYNLMACVVAKDRFEFQEFLENFRNQFSDIISTIHAPILFAEHKHTYFPPACLSEENVKSVESFLTFPRDANLRT